MASWFTIRGAPPPDPALRGYRAAAIVGFRGAFPRQGRGGLWRVRHFPPARDELDSSRPGGSAAEMGAAACEP